MKKTHLLSALLALVLGAASAQSAAPTLPDSTFASSLKQLAASGVKITLLNAAGQTVATISADGTLSLVKGFTLADATTVKAGSVTYTLATRATASGTLFVSYQGTNGPKVTLPLIAAVNRDAAAARAAAARQNAAKASSAASKPAASTAKPAATAPDTAGKPSTTGAGAAQNGLTNPSAATGATNSETGVAAAAAGAGNAQVSTQPAQVSTQPAQTPAQPAQVQAPSVPAPAQPP
ncbi:hypothetical protein ACFSC4_17780 [Deinococcus malanensis]